MKDIENMAMPKEVEELLNNENKKENVSINVLEISVTKGAILYTLDFLEENVKLYEKYFLHWTCWFEDETEKEYIQNSISESSCFIDEEEDFVNMVKNFDFKKGSCKKIFDNIYIDIKNCRESLQYDKFVLKTNIGILKHELEKIRAYVVYVYCEHSYLNPYTDDCELYYHILNIPLFIGRLNISDILEELCDELEEKCFDLNFDYKTINNESSNNNEENKNN